MTEDTRKEWVQELGTGVSFSEEIVHRIVAEVKEVPTQEYFDEARRVCEIRGEPLPGPLQEIPERRVQRLEYGSKQLFLDYCFLEPPDPLSPKQWRVVNSFVLDNYTPDKVLREKKPDETTYIYTAAVDSIQTMVNKEKKRFYWAFSTAQTNMIRWFLLKWPLEIIDKLKFHTLEYYKEKAPNVLEKKQVTEKEVKQFLLQMREQGEEIDKIKIVKFGCFFKPQNI